jgi:ABC-type multidrug transport system ATPase subunit
VWFAYQGEDWVLRDVSFTIAPGETIAVVGHTGAGKTTLISLLLRFYDVQRGSIRVGGVDVRAFDPLELRRMFGVVLQDPYLFTGTLAENIRLGTEGIHDDAVEAAAEQVNLMDFIRGLPEGFGHGIRERGSGLSTGQKQLISFARALAHNPRYLILDEATSSVDTETEFRVRDALNRMVEGRTSVVIAHRLSTIQRADRILVMHKGKLRESGTHQELLAQRGIYWKLAVSIAVQGSGAGGVDPQDRSFVHDVAIPRYCAIQHVRNEQHGKPLEIDSGHVPRPVDSAAGERRHRCTIPIQNDQTPGLRGSGRAIGCGQTSNDHEPGPQGNQRSRQTKASHTRPGQRVGTQGRE